MPNSTNESRAVDIVASQPVDEEDPALSESGTHPVAVRASEPRRPSYRPVARSAEEMSAPIPEDPETSRERAALGDLLLIVNKCTSRLRRHW